MAIDFDAPPINDPIIDQDGMMDDNWRLWFNDLQQNISSYLSKYAIQVPEITTVERDAIMNQSDRLFIKNSTTGTYQMREAGVWKNVQLF
jgi:hypothetical protein